MLTREAHRWWPRDFYASADPKGMKFDATLGGKLYEESAGRRRWCGLVHSHRRDPGHVGRSCRPPDDGVRRAGADSVAAGASRGRQTHGAELSDAVVGNVGERTEATLEKGWRALFETGFKKFVETAVKA